MIRRVLVVFLWTVLLTAQDRTPADLLQMAVPEGALRIAYGEAPLQFGELRLPTGRGPHPVAVIVHGGCWMSKLGNLDEHAVALDLLRQMAATLAENGIATWNVEYRRLGNAGGGWPGTLMTSRNRPPAEDCPRIPPRTQPRDGDWTFIGWTLGAVAGRTCEAPPDQ